MYVSAGNMAWFEVQRLLQAKNRSSSEEISDPKHLGMIEMNSHVLLVQYNPTGMAIMFMASKFVYNNIIITPCRNG